MNHLLDTQKKETFDDSDAIRASLPGQIKAKQIEIAICTFGRIWTRRELYRKISRLIPWRVFDDRMVNVSSIQSFDKIIPADALLKYQQALELNIFQSFVILEPYYKSQLPNQDPWLVGIIDKVDETWGYDSNTRMIVIAQWE